MKKTLLFALLMIVAGSASSARLMLPFTEYYGYPGYVPEKQHFGMDCHRYCKDNNWTSNGEPISMCVYQLGDTRLRTGWTAWPEYRSWVWANRDVMKCHCGLPHPETGDCSIYMATTHMQYKEALCADGAKPRSYGCDAPIFEYEPDIEEYDTPPEVVD